MVVVVPPAVTVQTWPLGQQRPLMQLPAQHMGVPPAVLGQMWAASQQPVGEFGSHTPGAGQQTVAPARGQGIPVATQVLFVVSHFSQLPQLLWQVLSEPQLWQPAQPPTHWPECGSHVWQGGHCFGTQVLLAGLHVWQAVQALTQLLVVGSHFWQGPVQPPEHWPVVGSHFWQLLQTVGTHMPELGSQA
jgi:hypothetical protein